MITGLPLHPLIVHLTVVAVPVAAMLLWWSLFKPVRSWVVSAMTFLAFAATAITNEQHRRKVDGFEGRI